VRTRLIAAAAKAMAEDAGDPYDEAYPASHRLWTHRAEIATEAVLLELATFYPDETARGEE
jgi:hypothetical protein